MIYTARAAQKPRSSPTAPVISDPTSIIRQPIGDGDSQGRRSATPCHSVSARDPQLRSGFGRPLAADMAGTAAEGRGGPHNTHEEHQSFIRSTAEKFHLKKTEGSITRKTVRCTGAAGSSMSSSRLPLRAQAMSAAQHRLMLCCKQAAKRCAISLKSIAEDLRSEEVSACAGHRG